MNGQVKEVMTCSLDTVGVFYLYFCHVYQLSLLDKRKHEKSCWIKAAHQSMGRGREVMNGWYLTEVCSKVYAE